jgi:hypothetical protein
MFPAYFCTKNFWGVVNRYTVSALIVALSPGHSDITGFSPWSPILTGNHLGHSRRKIPKVAQTIGTVEVFDPH